MRRVNIYQFPESSGPMLQDLDNLPHADWFDPWTCTSLSVSQAIFFSFLMSKDSVYLDSVGGTYIFFFLITVNPSVLGMLYAQ